MGALALDVGFKGKGLIQALLIAGAHRLDEEVIGLIAVQQLVNQPRLQGQGGGIAARGSQPADVVVDVVIDTAGHQVALGLHGRGVLAPQHLQPAFGDLLLRRRHIVPQKSFRNGLEIPRLENVHVDRQFFQRVAEIIAVTAEALQGHAAIGVHDHSIGVTGQQVLALGIEIAHCHHRLAAGLERLQRHGDFLDPAESHVQQLIQFHDQRAHRGIVPGVVDGIDHVPQQHLVLGRGGLDQQGGQGIHLAALVHHRTHQVQQQRGLLRWRLFAAAHVDEIDQYQQQQEQDIGQRQPHPGDAIPDSGQYAPQARGFTHDSFSWSRWSRVDGPKFPGPPAHIQHGGDEQCHNRDRAGDGQGVARQREQALHQGDKVEQADKTQPDITAQAVAHHARQEQQQRQQLAQPQYPGKLVKPCIGHLLGQQQAPGQPGDPPGGRAGTAAAGGAAHRL